MAKHYKINKKKFIRFIAAVLILLLIVILIISAIVKKIKNKPDPIPEDSVRPEVKLEGPGKIYIVKGGSYTEYGYSASDDVDGDLTDKVEISWDPEFDANSSGEYIVSYIATDAAGNAARERRRVIVVDDASGIESAAFTDDMVSFDLNKYYKDVLCKETEFDEAKYEDLLFFGDSFIEKLGEIRLITPYQYWSKPSISTDDFYTKPINYYDGGWSPEELTFFDAMDKYKPETVLFLLNSDWTSRWTPEFLYESCDKAYAEMLTRYPDTTFIVCSIMPVEDYYDIDYVQQGKADFQRNDRINKMNAYMCELCIKYGLKFMNAAEAVRNPNTGACYDEYIYEPDGVHLSDAGCEKMLEYIKTHLDY